MAAYTKHKIFSCPECGNKVNIEFRPGSLLLRQEYGCKLLEVYRCPCGALIETLNEWVHRPQLVEWEDL